MKYSFDDVLLVPQFSNIESRKDVDVTTTVANSKLNLGIISSNMDTVTNSEMADAMNTYGAISCLHRFQTIEENIKQYEHSPNTTWVSSGIGDKELERMIALYDAGAETHLIDVAHAANSNVVKHIKRIKNYIISDRIKLVVGNFATRKEILDFNEKLGSEVDAYKIGVGGGGACTTRLVTGCGLPTLSSVMDCVTTGFDVIADGGIRNSGDFAKCMAAGAKAVMLGKVLCGTTESASPLLPGNKKLYRGSASLLSYQTQNKTSHWRTAEGESYYIDVKGSVKEVLQEFEAGLRSAMSYCNATNLKEFKENAEWALVSGNGLKESGPHGRLL